MIAALKESTLSSPLGTACCFLSTAPARTLRPGPSKALLFPSVGSDLWNIFAERKVTGKQDRTRKVVSHLVVKKILKFLISENRGNPCVLEVYQVMDTDGGNVIRILPADRGEHRGILHPLSFFSNHNCRVCVKGTGFPSLSPLVIKKKIHSKREERFLIFTSGFGFVVLCVDAVEHKAGGCS